MNSVAWYGSYKAPLLVPLLSSNWSQPVLGKWSWKHWMNMRHLHIKGHLPQDKPVCLIIISYDFSDRYVSEFLSNRKIERQCMQLPLSPPWFVLSQSVNHVCINQNNSFQQILFIEARSKKSSTWGNCPMEMGEGEERVEHFLSVARNISQNKHPSRNVYKKYCYQKHFTKKTLRQKYFSDSDTRNIAKNIIAVQNTLKILFS